MISSKANHFGNWGGCIVFWFLVRSISRFKGHERIGFSNYHEPCLVGEGGEICDTFELQQKQGMILGRETRVSNSNLRGCVSCWSTSQLDNVVVCIEGQLKVFGIWLHKKCNLGFLFVATKKHVIWCGCNVGVLTPFFLSFREFVTIIDAHNMLALMLDPRFKRLKCIIDFLCHDKAKLLALDIIVKSWSLACEIQPFLES